MTPGPEDLLSQAEKRRIPENDKLVREQQSNAARSTALMSLRHCCERSPE
jgi:hypothetical protein